MLEGFFFNRKPVYALASLAKKDRIWYASMLAKEIDCTYPHIVNIVNTLENAGLVTTEGQGRIKIIRLTANGEDLAHDFENILRRIERIEKGKGQKK
ncbi:hypothetical protein DRN74_01235 [Candidatus Micrarchaeota archaeon]|nr:MAG: hypothetical protein DRN74_01235 [Candidatus Micrarchaeota archaeon]